MSSREKKEVQEAAAVALGKIGPAGLKPLIATVKDRDKDASVRRNAVIGLSKMGTAARDAIPTLVGELEAKDDGKTKKMANPDSIKSDVLTLSARSPRPRTKTPSRRSRT